MAMVRPSVRVRSTANQSGLITTNEKPGYTGALLDDLNAFESDSFDSNSYVESKCQSLGEKGIRQLCKELQDLKRSSAEEMRKSVYANYPSFIRTSQELSDLESELISMRNLLANQVAIIHGLAEGTSLAMNEVALVDGDDKSYKVDEPVASDFARQAQTLPDVLDVLLAERRVEEVLALLDEGEVLVEEGKKRAEEFVIYLQFYLSEGRARLAEQLAEAAKQPSVKGAELRSAITALDRLGDGPRAHTLLLNSHHERLNNNIRTLRPSGTSYGGAYTAALSQLVFSAISQAVRDSVAVFGEQPAYASELVLWARSEVEQFAFLIKRHVLSSSAAAGGLRAAAECVQIALGHCALLEEQGLALSPLLTKLVRPSVEQALDANLKRIEESVAAIAGADDWVLTPAPANHGRSMIRSGHGSLGGGFLSHIKLSSSTHRLNSMVQDFLEDVAPIITLQLTGLALDGLAHCFDSYINLLIKAVPCLEEDEEEVPQAVNDRSALKAETEAQQLALIGNAAALADELLPRAAAKLVPHAVRDDQRSRRPSERRDSIMAATRLPELKEWRRRLQEGVGRLRDHFCQQHALDLIYFSEDVEAQLRADHYLALDDVIEESSWRQEPMPSKTFQALFAKLTSIAQTAADVLVGRERVVTVLLMRLTETIIFCLSDQEDFWDAFEEGPQGLGPIGLQQFILDMQFVIQMASHGRYSSRTLRKVILDITSRAVNAYAATGADPNSVLPEDDWFLASAQEALRKLLSGWSKGTQANGEHQLGSPTHSISTHSVSSMRSHGSD